MGEPISFLQKSRQNTYNAWPVMLNISHWDSHQGY